MRRRDGMAKLTYLIAGIIVVCEALMPWEDRAGFVGFTPMIPAYLHIAAAALILPVLYFMLQSDFRHKQQAFNLAMADLGRRLLFLDPYLDPEEFELQERMQGALLMPTQRALQSTLKTAGRQSLGERVGFYYRNLPSKTYESDRMGLLSIGHPRTAVSWGIAFALAWVLTPPFIPLPLMGIHIGTSTGLSMLPWLLVLYLYAARANTRFAFELALYDWLRLG